MAKEMTVAEFISLALVECGKTQKEIAREVGFVRPNFISMLKTGDAQVPPARVPELAEALGVSRSELMRRVLAQDHPEIWRAIRDSGYDPIELHEVELLDKFRAATRDVTEDAFDAFEHQLLEATFEIIAWRRLGRAD
ncbi:helix-turn-helix transcriptional regulator [Limibaculum sp. M0105]|uniref:Helix-turn-helix transcriptional regulator n=1 Tax=Thermohalobaculum xanthum TaxID=2753746 RepID=A0A8J7M9I7_9RHOB|nr:helix-turn-helix transcriptional regulator [Thermohalobaculum xanthum]MBK0401209.1 helix-turn-helix transcriptional regulator [Thermohalobaculum xanthum]